MSKTTKKPKLPICTVRVPVELLEEIDAIIHFKGFRSRNEFIETAMREKLNRLLKRGTK